MNDCPNCEYHRQRAARWRAEAYKLGGYDGIELPWVGLTDVEWMNIVNKDQAWFGQRPDEVAHEVAKLVEAKLKEKNT